MSTTKCQQFLGHWTVFLRKNVEILFLWMFLRVTRKVLALRIGIFPIPEISARWVVENATRDRNLCLCPGRNSYKSVIKVTLREHSEIPTRRIVNTLRHLRLVRVFVTIRQIKNAEWYC